jgi:hypothetical protein
MKSSVVGCGRNRHTVDIYFREIFGVTNEIFGCRLWSKSPYTVCRYLLSRDIRSNQ